MILASPALNPFKLFKTELGVPFEHHIHFSKLENIEKPVDKGLLGIILNNEMNEKFDFQKILK